MTSVLKTANFNVTKEAHRSVVLGLAAQALSHDSASARAHLQRALIELCRQGSDPVNALRETTDELAKALEYTVRVWAEAREIAEAGGR